MGTSGGSKTIQDPPFDTLVPGDLDQETLSLHDELVVLNVRRPLVPSAPASRGPGHKSSSRAVVWQPPRGCEADAGVSAVGAGCPQLTSLDLHDCKEVTDVGVSAVGAGCMTKSL